MLIDDVKIEIRAGCGGDGAVAFNKTKMSLGPTGGNGGDGGSVFFEGVSDISALFKFRGHKKWEAQDGKKGGSRLNDGTGGEELILKVPVGTVAHNLATGEDFEITEIGQKFLAAKGGHGGKGNYKFRSAVNMSPTEFQEGLPGDENEWRLELKLIADVGFVGLPNVGKSSLLNSLTKANVKVANYAFTTLEPNLGAYYELILADIPGLIEGASFGKGLGIKFLRHIERTKKLFHFISAESENPVDDYETIRKELGVYNEKLLEKPEYIFLSKSDVLDEKGLREKMKELKKIDKEIIPVSIIDDESIKKVEEILRGIIKEKIAKK